MNHTKLITKENRWCKHSPAITSCEHGPVIKFYERHPMISFLPAMPKVVGANLSYEN